MTIKLRPYQKKGVRKVQHFRGRALLADDMGLGKTIQALTWLKQNKHARPVVVICPASVKYTWEREALIHVGLRAEVLEGQKPNKRKRLTRARHLVIINYDILQYWVHLLKKLKPQAVIIDESQYIGNKNTKRTKAVQELCEDVPHVVALSGTPFTRKPVQLFPTVNILREDVFPNFYTFAKRYCKPKRTRWGYTYNGATRIKELNRLLLQTCMIRRTKREVIHDLPRTTRNVVLLPISHPREYEMAHENFMRWLTRKDRAAAERAKGVEKAQRYGHLKRLAETLKLPFVYEWLDDYLNDTDSKLVIFGAHNKNLLHPIHERYRKHSVLITGDVTGRKRQQAITKFCEHKDIRFCICNIKAVGVGVDGLQHVCSDAAFVGMGFTPADHSQAEGRLDRLGQKEPMTFHYLIANNTIEVQICKVIERNQKILDGVLDGRHSQASTLDIYDQIAELVTCQTKND